MGEKMMMNSVMLVKAQTDAATDPVPGAANGLLTTEPQFTVDGKKIESKMLRSSLSPRGSRYGSKQVKCSFDTELKNSGVVGQDPQWMPAALACGLGKEPCTCVPIDNVVGDFEVGEVVTGTGSGFGTVEVVLDDHLILSHVSQVDLTVSTVVGTFEVGETVTGSGSGATGEVLSKPDVTSLILGNTSGTFLDTDNLTGGTSGATAAVDLVTDVPLLVTDELTGGTSAATADVDHLEAAELTISNVVGTFVVGETVTGAPSAATGIITRLPNATSMVLKTVSGTFTAEDTLAGGTSEATADCDGLEEDVPVYQPGSMLKPIKSNFGMCAFYWFMDGIKHPALAARGNLSMEFPVDDTPLLKFSLTGNYVTPTDTAAPDSPTFDENDAPIIAGVDLQIGDFATPVAEKLTLDLGNSVNPSKSMRAANGIKEIKITGRAPKGTIDPEVETLAVYNPWSTWEAHTKIPILCDVPGSYGSRILAYVHAAQKEAPKYSDKRGLAAYQISFEPTGTEDEIRLLVW
jgi:hypothetical protein